MNTKYLKDVKCPICDSEGPFLIYGEALMTISDDTVVDIVEFSWDESSTAKCTQCNTWREISEFTSK